MEWTRIRGFAKTFLDLTRPRNMLMAFVGVVTGGILYSPGAYSIPLLLVAALSASLILAAGNSLNDYFDHEIDRVNRPARPIPSGRIGRSDTLMLSIVLFLCGLALSKWINDYTLLIALANTMVLVVYAAFSKRLLLLANITVSYLVGSLFIYGAATALLPGDEIVYSLPVIILAVCSFFLTLSREIVKDVEDLPGDQKMYSHTLPIHVGEKTAIRAALAFTLIAIGLSILPMTAGSEDFNLIAYIPLIIIADTMFLISYTMHSSLHQRFLVAGMFIALLSFLLATITT